MNPLAVTGSPPSFTSHTYLHRLAQQILPVEGYVLASELVDTPEEVGPMTDILDAMIEVGAAVSILTVVGDDKQWVYGRLHATTV